MIDFSVSPSLPPSDCEIEERVLGAIILDPNGIQVVAETLPIDAFYISAHKDIYRACLALHKAQRPVDLLTVTSWLKGANLLEIIGGQNKLVTLVDRTVGSYHLKYDAETLTEKYIRRQLISLLDEANRKAHSEDKPLSWTLENLEQRILSITQLRNSNEKGYWQKIDQIAFERLCKELESIEEHENAARRDWLMRKLAKKWKFSSKKELLDFHAKWLDSKNETKTYSAQEYFQKYGQSDQAWLIPGFVPSNSVIVLYADGGVGKTRLAFTLAKHAISGGTFAYEGTEFEPMNTLLIETDQGPRSTSKLLEMQDFLDGSVCKRFSICDEWSVGEFGKLKEMIKKHEPKLIIIDSLTSISAESLYSENDTEYARPLIRLRQIAKEFGCSILMIHHSNAGGDMRGSRAIRNTVDEVWKFTKQQNEVGTFNVLTIDKTRSRGPGSYKFTYDDETWGWKFGGRLEDDILGNGLNSANVMNKCIQFLNQNKGIAFEAIEISEALGISSATVRKDLRRASTEGLVNVGRSSNNHKALVYYLGNRNILCLPNNPSDILIQPPASNGLESLTDKRSSDILASLGSTVANPTNDPSDPLTDHEMDHLEREEQAKSLMLKPLPDKDGYKPASVEKVTNRTSDPSDPSDPPFSDFSILKNSKTADHLDHLDHLGLYPLPDIENQVIRPLDQMDHLDHLDKSEVLEPEPLPDIESPKNDSKKHRKDRIKEDEVYYSLLRGKKVKVVKTYPSVQKADVFVKGEILKEKAEFSDLFPLPNEENWQPQLNQVAMYGSDLVAIVGFASGKKFQIEFKSGKLMFVRASALKKPS